jgi:hypothetical protein
VGRKLIFAGSVLLSAVVIAGTALYVQGTAPPFPANMWGFNGLTLVCIAWAFAFGRR